jgi:hypothetical protein
MVDGLEMSVPAGQASECEYMQSVFPSQYAEAVISWSCE